MGGSATALHEIHDADLRALIELAPDGIFIADLSGRYVFVNEAGCRMLGYSPEELVGRSIVDLIPSEDAPRLAESKSAMLGGATHVAEWRLRRKDGSWVPVEVSARIDARGNWQGFVRDIAERRRHEQRLELALEGSSAALWDTDLRSGEVVLSAAWSEMLGGPREETRTTVRELTALIHPEDAEGALAASIETLKGRRSHYFWEHRVRTRSGGWIWILCRGKVTERDPATGRALRMIGTNIDISERKAHEAEHDALLRESDAERRWLQTVMDALPLGIVLYRPDGQIAFNRRTEELLRVTLSRSGGRSQYANLIRLPDGAALPAEALPTARIMRDGVTVIAEEYLVQRPDGSRIPVLASGAPIRDAHGAVIGAVGVFQDVSERMRMEESIRRNERLLQGIFDILPVGVWIADASGRIVSNNPAGERIWRGTRYVPITEFGQYKGWWLDSGKPIAAEEWALARALRRGETSTGELVRIQCFDGSFKVIINSAAPLRDEKGAIVGAIVVNEDVTALQHAQDQLRAAVRDREQILAIVTHDLRNPLSSLIMSAAAAEHMARGLPGGERVRELAAAVIDSTRTMSGMVDDLLAIAVATAGGASLIRFAPVAAAALVGRAADAARPLLARESLELRLHVSGGLPTLRVDAERILRVFANLLDNALKFTSAPGCVTLSAEPSKAGVRFSVANSGPALPRNQLDAMFRPFWQAGRDRRGAGLGLAICRSIVEAHGGSIWAEPAAGQRVRICFILPRQPLS